MNIVKKSKEFIKKHKAEIAIYGISIAATAIIGSKFSYKKGFIKGGDYILSAQGVDPHREIFYCSTKVAATEILDKAKFVDKGCKEFLEKNKDKMFDIKFLFN